VNTALRPLGEWAVCGLAFATCAGEALAWQPVLLGKVCGAVFVAVSLALLLLRSERPVLPRAFVWIGLLFLLCAASLLWTADPSATGRASAHLLLEGLLLLGLAQWTWQASLLRRLAWGAAGGALFLGLALLWTFVMGEERGLRIVVGEGDPNLQARQLGLGLLLGLAQFEHSSRTGRRGVLSLGLVAVGVALGITGSRGAVLAVLGGLGVWGWPKPSRGIALALALALVLGMGATELRSDLRSTTASVLVAEREALSSGRDAIWANSLDLLLEHPVLGVGAAAIPAVYDAVRDERMAAGGLHSKRGRDAHSLYLQLLVGLGPLGLVLFLVAAGVALRDIWARPERRASLALLLFLGLSAATQSTLELKDFWLGFAWAALPRRPD
jgi:putative inorganic carbon (HCO3(-)) transporter